MLHSTPRYLHRFYTDVSMMSHNDAEGGQSFTVSSQKASQCAFAYIPFHFLNISPFSVLVTSFAVQLFP